jgi:hypothetical protein
VHRVDGEPLEMHVADLLMRLELNAQDVQYNLRDASDLAILNLPKCMRDIGVIQTEACALQARTDKLRRVLKGHLDNSDAPRIQALCGLDAIKLKAEECVGRLDEAEKLDNLRQKVENAFRADDLHEIAKAVGDFRVSLDVVGDLREARVYREKLEEWMGSLEAKVLPLLRRAVDEQRAGGGGEAGALMRYREVLDAAGRAEAVEACYAETLQQQILDMWRGFDESRDAADLGGWVEKFLSGVVTLARRDMEWCGGGLLPKPRAAIRAAVSAALAGLSPPLEKRAEAALRAPSLAADAGCDLLCALHSVVLLFVEALDDALSSESTGPAAAGQAAGGAGDTDDGGGRDEVLAALCQPFLALQPRHTSLEQVQLGAVAERAVSALARAGREDAAQLAQLAEEGLRSITGAACAAVERCLLGCAGVEIERLLQHADGALVVFLEALTEAVQQLGRGKQNGCPAQLTHTHAPPSTDTNVALRPFWAGKGGREAAVQQTSDGFELQGRLAAALRPLPPTPSSSSPPPSHTAGPFEALQSRSRKTLLGLRAQLFTSSGRRQETDDGSEAVLADTLCQAGLHYCALQSGKATRLGAFLGRVGSLTDASVSSSADSPSLFPASTAAAQPCILAASRLVFRLLFRCDATCCSSSAYGGNDDDDDDDDDDRVVVRRPMRASLAGLATWPQWAAADTAQPGAGGARVATGVAFSLPPSEYVHTVAEQLLNVPALVHAGSLDQSRCVPPLLTGLRDGTT